MNRHAYIPWQGATVLDELSATMVSTASTAHSIVATQPYYLIGQWRLLSDRQVRAFVCSRRGTLHITRAYDDGCELTSEERSDCERRIFPDVLRRLQDFDLKFPGLLEGQSFRSPVATGVSAEDTASVQQRGVESSGRFGELLVQERVITHEQREVALRLQVASPSYVPIGHVLLTQKFISRKTLMMMLHRYQKKARLGEILLKAGRITASQLAEGLDYHRRTSVPLGQIFMRLGLSETALRDALCMQAHVNFVDIDAIVIDRDLARLISEPFARRHSLVPLLRMDNVVVIAMDDPSQAGIIAAIESALGLQIEAVTTLTTKLEAAINRLYTSTGSFEMRPMGGNVIVGPIRDHAVAELVIRASPWARQCLRTATPGLAYADRKIFMRTERFLGIDHPRA
jgi:hypothetical protein